MAKIKEWILEHDGKILKKQWHYRCPGCGTVHAVGREPGDHTFNGDLERPTFRPSLLQNWPGVPVCHSYITDGRIQFLSDCSHSLAGQTVDLPDIE
jgi:hypothetical protein